MPATAATETAIAAVRSAALGFTIDRLAAIDAVEGATAAALRRCPRAGIRPLTRTGATGPLAAAGALLDVGTGGAIALPAPGIDWAGISRLRVPNKNVGRMGARRFLSLLRKRSRTLFEAAGSIAHKPRPTARAV